MCLIKFHTVETCVWVVAQLHACFASPCRSTSREESVYPSDGCLG